ncbi:HAD hydrolase-like protein [Actinacidiphila soli]|nr:HAD hydrolase-like protein [Actinacidiphila soli]
MIGDTPADVAAGLANQVPVLAVASGRSTDDDPRQPGRQK